MRECRQFEGSTATAIVLFKEPDTLALIDVIEPVEFLVVEPNGGIIDGIGDRVSLGTYEFDFYMDSVGDYTVSARSSGSKPATVMMEIHAYPTGYGP